jgi:hypothetical protein
MDIQCYLILQDHNMGGIFYRISIWYKDDPNRYVYTKFDYEWNFDKTLPFRHLKRRLFFKHKYIFYKIT